MTSKKVTEEMLHDFFELIIAVDNEEDCRLLFNDLCTFKEIEQMALRIRAAKLLMDGKTYIQIMNEVDVSSATLSRISRCVQYGGGYTKFLSTEDSEKE